MRHVTIDLTNIHTPKAALIYIGYVMDFPPHFGRNLDALHDLLAEIGEPTRIEIRRPAHLSPQMEAYVPRLMRVLEDAARENACLDIA